MNQFEQLEQAISEGVDSKLGVRKELKRIQEHLTPDEAVHYVTEGYIDSNRGLVVVTNQRVIFFSAGLVRSRIEEFPIKSVSSINYKTGMVYGAITIHTSNNKAEIKNIMKPRAVELVQIVRSLTESHQSPGSSGAPDANQSDAVGQLREYAQLRDDGIISEAELQAKKKEILEP